MHKKILSLVCLVLALRAGAQTDSSNIKSAIARFFEGMHTWDTAKINSSLDSSIFLYSVMNGKAGTLLEKETKEEFFQQVVSLHGKQYEERLLSYDIKTDGSMAIA